MKYDIIVIGAGPGGYVAAIKAAQLGKKTAIVERAELGGVCLNWGCIPTKAIIKSASVFESAASAATYGVDIEGEVKPNMPKIVERSRSISEMMSKGIEFLLKKNEVDVLVGEGKVAGKGKVEVRGEEGAKTYEAEHIIVATGARPRDMPSIPVDGKKVLNSRHALLHDSVPESIIVVGSGAIGCEFAYIYATLGSKVTLVEYMPEILPLEDEEVSKYMNRTFRRMRAKVMAGTAVKSVEVVDGKCKVEIEGKKGLETLESDVVLSAVGVQSNIENIGLEEIGVALDRGKVVVDHCFKTNIEGVYAIGDIIATPALAHVASAEAVCCVEGICGLNPEPIDYSTIPGCVYTIPEVASVGMTEQKAREEGIEIAVGKFPFTASGKATTAGNRDGFAKLIFEKESRQLIGAHFVGLSVTEMIAEPALAKTLGATAEQIAKTIHAHPTMNEAVMEAAEAAFGEAIHA